MTKKISLKSKPATKRHTEQRHELDPMLRAFGFDPVMGMPKYFSKQAKEDLAFQLLREWSKSSGINLFRSDSCDGPRRYVAMTADGCMYFTTSVLELWGYVLDGMDEMTV